MFSKNQEESLNQGMESAGWGGDWGHRAGYRSAKCSPTQTIGNLSSHMWTDVAFTSDIQASDRVTATPTMCVHSVSERNTNTLKCLI